jgi:hypothetical protein
LIIKWENGMLRPGFEPESSARKAGMIDRTTLPEQWFVFSYPILLSISCIRDVPLRLDQIYLRFQ